MSAEESRERYAKALRGSYPSTDMRPSYRAADAVLATRDEELERLRVERDALQGSYNGANAMMGVHKRRAALLRERLDHATAALAGNDEGIRLFMADHEQRVERMKEQARLAGIDAANNEAELGALSDAIERVRAVHVISDLGECIDCRASWPCPTITALDAPGGES